jgi:DNA-binding transcriptional LysR family regulator
MDLKALRHIVTLARHLNFTRAAEELGLSQPALTRSIQAIEAQAGARLFDRDRGGVHMTQLGRAVAGKAIGLLEDAAEIDQMLHRFARAEAGEIAFGMAPLPARVMLPSVLVEGLSAWPQLRSRISIRGPQELLELVATGKIEFSIGPERMLDNPPHLKVTQIGSLPLSLLVRRQHPLLRGGSSELRKHYPLVVSGPIGEAEFLPRHLREHLSQQPHIVLDDFDILARITEQSDSIWLSSTFAARDEIREGRLTELPIGAGQDLGHFKIVMYSLERRSLSPAALLYRNRFQQLIRSYASG